jgi:hypothetical protein
METTIMAASVSMLDILILLAILSDVRKIDIEAWLTKLA